MKYETTVGLDKYIIEIDDNDTVTVENKSVACDFQRSPDPNLYSLILDNESYDLRITEADEAFRVLIEGDNLEVKVTDERSRRLASVKKKLSHGGGDILVTAPMPGLIIDTLVKPGDTVQLGQPLVILESMKMHNEFKAPPQRSGQRTSRQKRRQGPTQANDAHTRLKGPQHRAHRRHYAQAPFSPLISAMTTKTSIWSLS